MKLAKPKFPFMRKFDPSFEAELPFLEENISEKEFMDTNNAAAEAENLIKQNRIAEFKKLIDKKNILDEHSGNEPGISTRSYLDNLLGEQIIKENPELLNFHEDKKIPELVKQLKNKFYPQINELGEVSGNSYDVSANKGEGDNYNPSRGLNIDPNQHSFVTGKVGTIMHELGHQLDKSIESGENKRTYPLTNIKRKSVNEFLDKLYSQNPKYKELANTPNPHEDEMTHSEAGATNNPIPNFRDYDYGAGEFKSDFVRNPTDLQDEIAKKHHKNRNYPFDNLINLIQKGKGSVK